MTVEVLIELLSKFHPEMEVIISDDFNEESTEIDEVEVVEETVYIVINKEKN